MQVVQPTTPAQVFHLLRRQMIRLFRKPLIIFTPKSLLRHKEAVSDLTELSKGSFQPVIGEVEQGIEPKKVKRVVVCSGRVYYDLVAHRREAKSNDVAIVRIEQLYPFAHKQFDAEIKKYENATEVVWVQDEPQNQGAWFYVEHHLREGMRDGMKLAYSGRPASASPAVGYYAKHYEQQKALVEGAFGRLKGAQIIAK
jgi:2-oxoglutarate dehydrogenase E1 component